MKFLIIFLLLAPTLFGRPIQFTIFNSENGRQEAAKVRATPQGGSALSLAVPEENIKYSDPSGGWFYTWGNFTLDVPAGPLTVELEKGFFYRPATYTFDVPASGQSNVTLKIYPWIDLVKHGWYTGDAHTHANRTELKWDDFLLVMAAKGRNVTFNLGYNAADSYSPLPQLQKAPQLAGMGDASDYIRGDYAFSSGQEYISGPFGHNGLLCADSLVWANGPNTEPNVYPPSAIIFDQARRLNGFKVAHHVTGIYLADAALGKVDLVETNTMGSGNYYWLVVRNSGVILPLIFGSDNSLGKGLTGVFLTDTLSPRGWATHLKSGMNFATNGPFVFLKIEDRGPGQCVTFEGTTPRTVTIEAWAYSELHPLRALHIKRNGQYNPAYLKTVSADSNGRSAYLKTTVTVNKSSWFYAVAEGNNAGWNSGDWGLSGAITVMLDRQLPVYRSNESDNVASIGAAVGDVQDRINNIQSGSFGTQAQKDTTLALYNKALAFYQSLLSPPPANDPAPGPVTGLKAHVSLRSQTDYLKLPNIIPPPSNLEPIWN